MSASCRKLVREFQDRAEAFEATHAFLPPAEAIAARAAAGAYRECARLLAGLSDGPLEGQGKAADDATRSRRRSGGTTP